MSRKQDEKGLAESFNTEIESYGFEFVSYTPAQGDDPAEWIWIDKRCDDRELALQLLTNARRPGVLVTASWLTVGADSEQVTVPYGAQIDAATIAEVYDSLITCLA